MTKRALITGITGQDGSYLAEFLLEKGYKVYGAIRRTSIIIDARIGHFMKDVELIEGDLLDQYSLVRAVQIAQPDEIYNLAAQSFVPTSWAQPALTGEYTALGVTKMLEAARSIDKEVRFYQASSSEMFGKVVEVPQSEKTPFYPRSPYGVAKVYGHWITVNYRESYNMHTSSGILFNHECISGSTPLMVRQDGLVNVMTAEELVPLIRKGHSQQTFEVPGLEVWDGKQWTGVKAITATRRLTTDPDHQMLLVQARGGLVQVTAHHQMLDADYEPLAAHKVEEGMRLALAESMPTSPGWTVLTEELAEFMGLMVAEGYISDDGKLQFTNNDPELRDRVATLWSKLFMGTVSTRFFPSGFNPERQVGQMYLNGGKSTAKWLRERIYGPRGDKRVPAIVLNSTLEIQEAFLRGYYAGDGLKAGSGDSIKTNSELLAQGLCWLYANQGRTCSAYVEQRGEWLYYQLNVSSANQLGNKGQHLRKDAAQVRRVTASPASNEWVYDLETESGVFCAGVGRLVVHNSPRRGLEFSTRKISNAVARIKLGLQDELRMGNLDSRRDWGYAPDYVRAMWLMLQQEKPDDYVIATGETHAIREFVELAFKHAGISNWQDYVKIDQKFFRPAEVDLLVGDPTKAKQVLGWEPTVTFEQLVQIMVDADIEFNQALMNKR